MKTIGDAIRNGEPIDFTPFIDVHGHFGPWMDTCVPYCRDDQRLVAEMDRFGCDMVWMTASDPGYTESMRIKNDYVFDLAAKHPDRVIPFCTLSAHSQTGCLKELKRCLGRGRCIGVKMHRYNQPAYTLKSKFLQPVLELMEEHRLVYMNHDLGEFPDIRWAAKRYPKLIFMGGHFNPALNEMAGTVPNVTNCTCAAMRPDAVGDEVKRLGRSRALLVGSDFGLFCLAFGVGMVAYAAIPETDKQNILGLNAVRLLERTQWFKASMLRCTRTTDR